MANALDTLTSLLNLIILQLSYFGTAKKAGKVVGKTGMFSCDSRSMVVRVLKTVFTETQKKYANAKEALVKSLSRFNDSLWDAGLMIGIG
jgi:hypothetical protein